MNILASISALLLWTIIGSSAFNIYVVIAFRTGIIYTAREQDGTLKKRQPLAGILNSLLLLGLIIGLLLVASYFSRQTWGQEPGFWLVFTWQYTLFLLLFAYDTLVIDAWVIARWRPACLHIPPEMKAASMRTHIRASLIAGPVLGALLTLLSAGLAWWIWFGA